MAKLVTQAQAAFSEAFGGSPTFYGQAPSRVELLGNHTDYNGGLVLAAAIDRFTVVAGRPVDERRARVRSVQFGQDDTFPLTSIERTAEGSWSRYVRGVVWSLSERLEVRSGFDAAIVGEVPLGAGLSSSASLEAALAMFLIAAGALGDPAAKRDDEFLMALAQWLQRAENEFVGVASGLLDPFSVLFGRAGHALFLDCRSFEYERLSLGNPAPAIVVCDSKTSRRLADGMYNKRRAECERVVSYFQQRRGPEKVRWLRDLTLDDLHAAWDDLDPVGRLRARHVLTENERVRQGVEALRADDILAFGRLMSASHASSRDDFGNSSPALDDLVDAAENAPGFYGGKLSGAGWAGCTVNLVEAELAESFVETVATDYTLRTGTKPEIHICRAADGASASSI